MATSAEDENVRRWVLEKLTADTEKAIRKVHKARISEDSGQVYPWGGVYTSSGFSPWSYPGVEQAAPGLGEAGELVEAAVQRIPGLQLVSGQLRSEEKNEMFANLVLRWTPPVEAPANYKMTIGEGPVEITELSMVVVFGVSISLGRVLGGRPAELRELLVQALSWVLAPRLVEVQE